MKVGFFTRVGAYIVDLIIIMIISSLIGMCLPEKNNDINERITELASKLTAGEIEADAYITEYEDLLYEQQKANKMETGVSLVITIAYFVVFQYMNKGQTLGKKLLGIRVVDADTKEPLSIPKGLLRTLIPFGVASSALNLIFLALFNKAKFMNAYLLVSTIEVIFIILTIIFILYRSDGRGLHDLMANSLVVKDGEK